MSIPYAMGISAVMKAAYQSGGSIRTIEGHAGIVAG